MSKKADKIEKSTAKQQEEDYRFYQLARVDFLLKLSENNLREQTILKQTPQAILAVTEPTRMDDAQKVEWLDTLNNKRKDLLEQMGITLPA